MSPDNTHEMYLQADGDNPRVSVKAYLDSYLEKSLISENKAEETNAIVEKLEASVVVKDERGRQYTCKSTITVSWYIDGKHTVTFEETFYVFTPSKGTMDVLLRRDIEPNPVEIRDGPGDLYTLENAIETEEGHKEQKTHDQKQLERRKKDKAEREKEWKRKYNGTGSNGANGGSSGNDGVSRTTAVSSR